MSFSNIIDYIPQRPPMVMVGEIVEVQEEEILTQFVISEDNLLVENGFLSESGIIENIAQTAAAFSGVKAKMNNEKVKVGFIGSVRNLQINSLPKVESTIQTSVKLVGKVMNVDMIEGKITQNGNLIAQCEMRIFLEE